MGCGAGIDLVRFAQGRGHRHRRGHRAVGHRAGAAELRAAGAARPICAMADGEHLPFPDDTFDFVFAHGVVQYTADDRALVDECRRVLKPGGDGGLPGLQPHLVAERAVEGDEGRPRARGRAGAAEVQRRRVPRAARRLSRRAHRRRAISGEVAAARRLEGRAVQHVLRRHVQRAAARAGRGASAGTCWRSARK